ncbi:MAG: PilZ domain-containing protein [Nitrospira sp.]
MPALRRSLSNISRSSHAQSPSQLRSCRGVLPVWFKSRRSAPSSRLGYEGVIDNLSIRGCRIRSTAPMRIGSRLELEFQHSDSSFPVTIEEAVVRSLADGAIGLRFTKLHRSDERRIRQLIDVWLPELLPASN